MAVGRTVLAYNIGVRPDGGAVVGLSDRAIADGDRAVYAGLLREVEGRCLGADGDGVVSRGVGRGAGRNRAAAGGRAALSHGDGIAAARARLTAEGNRAVGGDRVGPNRNRDESFGARSVPGGDAAAANRICAVAESRAELPARHGVRTKRRAVDGGGLDEEADRNGEVVGCRG